MRLLVNASKKGEFLVPSQFSGTWVKAGDTDFQDDKDQVYALYTLKHSDLFASVAIILMKAVYHLCLSALA